MLTESNACNLIRAGSVVQVKAGPPPPEDANSSLGARGIGTGTSSLPPLTSTTSRKSLRRQGSGQLPPEGSGFWLPSQHLGDVGVHGAKALYGSKGPKSGMRGGAVGADFGATRRSRGGAGGDYPDPATVSAASIGITVPDMDGVVQEDLALEDLSTWMNSYQSEVVSFSSSALNAELRYEEVLRSTAALGSPNAVRTRVVCQLLDAIVMRFGRFQRITQRLLHDVFTSVFVDPDAPDAVPYFLRYARVQSQLNELRGKHEMLQKSLQGEEDRSAKRWSYINRTLKNMFNSHLVAAFRQWKLRVEEHKSSRDLIQRMIKKWRRQDVMRALYQWKQNAASAKQERTDSAVDELRAVNEELRMRLEKTEAERDIANMEIARLNDEMAKVAADMDQVKAESDNVGRMMIEARQECATYKAYKAMAVEYREALSSVVAMKAAAAKEEMEARRLPDADPLHNAIEDSLSGVEPVDKVMRWMNHHLVQLGSVDTVSNLASDLKDGKELATLMHVAAPAELPVDKVLKEVDPARRAKFAVENAEEMFGFPHGCVDPSDVTNGDSTAVLPLVAWMMHYHHGMDRTPPTEQVLAECDAVVAAAAAATERPIEEEVSGEGVPINFSADLVAAVKKADEAVKDHAAKRELSAKKFEAYAKDVMSFTLQVLIQKSKGVEVEIKDDRRAGERAAMIKMSPERLADIVPDEGERAMAVDDLERILGGSFDELRRIYKFYASGGNMSNAEFWKFIKDTKIPTKKLAGEKIDQVFADANGPDAEGEVSDRELDPVEWMEAIVRIANVRESGSSLGDKTKSLITKQILPNACQSESEQFRAALAEKGVVEVYDRYRDNLRLIFKKYAKEDKGDKAAKAATDAMNFKEMVEMLKACGVYNNGVKQADLDVVFGAVQDSDGNDGGDAGDEAEMVFPEFLELVGAVGIFRNPNPFVPLHKRLEAFFENDICKPLKGKIKGLK